MRKITGIVVHCTATRPEWWAEKTPDEKRDECKRWHVDDNGWDDIGYHYLIDRDGTVTEGRPLGIDGAHAVGHNKGTVGIALWGGHGSNEKDQFHDHFTADQERALRQLVARLQNDHGDIDIIGHNQVAAKACPGFDVPSWLARKPKTPRKSVAQSKTIQSTVAAGAGAVASGATAIGALDGTAQIIAIAGLFVTVIALVVIFKERLRKWAAGDR